MRGRVRTDGGWIDAGGEMWGRWGEVMYEGRMGRALGRDAGSKGLEGAHRAKRDRACGKSGTAISISRAARGREVMQSLAWVADGFRDGADTAIKLK